MIVFVLLFWELYILLFEILRPRIAKHYDKNEISLFYFQHINGLDKKEFQKLNDEFKEEEINRHIVDQIYEVSKILEKKLLKLRNAIFIIYIQIALFFVLFMLVFTNVK